MSFTNLKKENLVRNQFDGLTSEVFEWELVTMTAFYKEELRGEAVDKEIVKAYLNAEKILYNALSQENNPAKGMRVFKDNQMCMPFLFLCRHTLELVLKYFLKHKSGQVTTGHKLIPLWEKTKMFLGDDDDIKGMGVFVEVLDSLDTDGTKMRYSSDKKGEPNVEMPTFIKADKLNSLCEEITLFLMKQIEAAED
jgi:hypothetical protein